MGSSALILYLSRDIGDLLTKQLQRNHPRIRRRDVDTTKSLTANEGERTHDNGLIFAIKDWPDLVGECPNARGLRIRRYLRYAVHSSPGPEKPL
jgi:hypothetical protein